MLRQLGFYLDMLTVLEKSGLPRLDAPSACQEPHYEKRRSYNGAPG